MTRDGGDTDDDPHDDHHGGGDHHDHGGHHAGDAETLSFSILSITSSRDRGEDESGSIARGLIEDAGHGVDSYEVVSDDVDAIRDGVQSASADVVVTLGGTGVTPDDVTVEALGPLFEKELPGFGEHFRRLSHDDIGERAMLSRAVAGTVDGTLVYALPGSTSAVELGVEAAILPVVGHAVGLVQR